MKLTHISRNFYEDQGIWYHYKENLDDIAESLHAQKCKVRVNILNTNWVLKVKK